MSNGNVVNFRVPQWMQTVSLQKGFLFQKEKVSVPACQQAATVNQREPLSFFLLMMAIKGDVTSYCESQACCLVFLQFPCCLETTMALQHLLMFDTLLNPQLLKEFKKNKYRRNKHLLCSLTPSQSVTSGVWNHSFIGRGETLRRTQKKNMRLYKSGACMHSTHSAA